MHRSASEGNALEQVFAISPSKRRIRDIIELSRDLDSKLQEQELVQKAIQRARFYKRWHHMRELYSYYKMQGHVRECSNQRSDIDRPHHNESPHRIKNLQGSPLTVACVELCVESIVSTTFMESIIYTALKLDPRIPATQTVVQTYLQCIHVPHYKKPGNYVDYREVCGMWDVLDNPTFPPAKRLSRWFDIFCCISSTNPGEVIVHSKEVRKMLHLVTSSPSTESDMNIFTKALIHSIGGVDGELRLKQLLAFADEFYDLQVLIRSLSWSNLTESQRIVIEKDEQEMTAIFIERERLHVQHTRAITYWKNMEPRRRFVRWKMFTDDSLRLKAGDAHATRYKYRQVVLYFKRNKQRVQTMKLYTFRAATTCSRNRMHRSIAGWISFWSGGKELEHLATIQSHRQYHMKRTLCTWRAWKTYTIGQRMTKRKLLQRVLELMHETTDKLLKKMLSAWKYYVNLEKLDRMSAKNQEEMIAANAEYDRYRHELFAMSLEDALAKEIQAEELAEIERARKAQFREQTRQVYAQRKIKQQEEARSDLKRRREEAQERICDTAWNDITKIAEEKTRKTVEEWLTTPEGQAELQAAATYIYEDPPNQVSQNLQKDPTYSNVPDCVWVCRLENIGGKHAKAYFYHTERLEKVLCDELTMKACLVIATEHIIQKRINAMKVQLAKRAEDEKVKTMRNLAANRIQMMFRCRQARKHIRSIMRTLFFKRIDPSTGRVAYYSVQKRTSSFVPPRLIGSAESSLPIESTTWVRRIDPNTGNQYYMDQTTEETSWMAPNHYVMCSKCRINFCTQRHVETGERFCISCYAEVLHTEREADKARRGERKVSLPERTKQWTRIAVVASKCCVCKVNLAEHLCHECHGDTTCGRCFGTLHRNPKLEHHCRHESLVHNT